MTGSLMALASATFLAAGNYASGADISYVDFVEGAQVTDWRTNTTTKSLDADGDNFYGSFAALHWQVAAANQQAAGSTTPGFAPITIAAGQATNPGYTDIDHINNFPANADAGIVFGNPARFVFEMTGTPDTYTGQIVRVGVMHDVLAPNEWGPDNSKGLQIVQTAGGTGDSGVIPLRVGVAADGVPEMYFFDLANVTAGDRFEIRGLSNVGGSTGQSGYIGPVSWDLVADDTPPTIATLDPDGATGIYPGAAVTATFNRSIALTGGGSITLTDTGDGSGTVNLNLEDSSQVAVSGRDLILTPPANLAFGTSFEVVIADDTIQDLASTPNTFTGTDPGQWTFTTAAQEFTAPDITPTSPQNGATRVALAAPLVATFNQSVLLSSAPEMVIYEEDFEDGDGGFTLSGSPNDWAWGTPDSDNEFNLTVTSGNGGSANAWGTNLGPAGEVPGGITVGTESVLIGPDATGNGIDLTGVVSAQLSFAAAIDAAAGDTVELHIREVGTGDLLTTLLPFGTSPLDDVVTNEWTAYGPFDLSAAAGHKVYLEFRHQGTDATYLGLYIDDVLVTGTDPFSVITLRNLTAGTDTVIPIDDASQVAVSGDTLTITPAMPLISSSDYAVLIGAGVVRNFSDIGFPGISDNSTWNFSTLPIIAGVTVEGFSSQLVAGFNRQAAFTVDGSGLEPNGPGTHSTVPEGTMWLSNGTFAGGTDEIGSFPNSYIEFNLGANHDLSSLTVWNYNEANLSARGSNNVTISVASSVGGTFTSLGDFVFDQAPGAANVDFAQIIDLSGLGANNVRLIRFDITSSHGGDNNFVGLSEVRFEGVVSSEPGDDTFANWIAGFPGVGGQTGFTDDPDGDGIPNGVEAWFGTSPAAASAGITQLSKTGSVFSFQHPLADPMLDDVTGSYEWSLDLETWHPDTTTTVGDTTVTINSTSNAGTATVTADTAGSVNLPVNLFLRAVATQN